MRTIVYVDGFNLYYGSLKGTAYKWLDLKALFSSILPGHSIIKIKYYTARVSARPGNSDGPIEQDAYLRAIKAFIPELEISFGKFLASTVRMPLAKPRPWQGKFCDVVKTEEKGSDVNLALHLLNDAWQDKYDYGVVVSNDSDLAESLRLVKKQHGKKIILLVPGNPAKRPPSIQLKRFAHKTISIPIEVVAASQLPTLIPGTTIHKPVKW